MVFLTWERKIDTAVVTGSKKGTRVGNPFIHLSKYQMVKVGEYNTLKVIRAVDFGVYLDDGAEGILLPRRFVPTATAIGDELKVFLYHDGEERLIATTQQPKGVLGDIVKLRAVSVTPQGAFLDLGLMKDI